MACQSNLLAVNDPNVVLGSADTRFVAPVKAGEVVVAVATRARVDRRKHTIDVVCSVGDTAVLKGTFTAFVLDSHVLAGR